MIDGDGGAAAGGEIPSGDSGAAVAAAPGVGVTALLGAYGTASDGSAAGDAMASAPPAFLESLSGELYGDRPSHRDWALKKGFKSIDDALKSYRDLEQNFLSGDKLVMPKEGDPPEAFEAFYKATGRPDKPEEYDLALPDGHELDEGLAKVIREAAFEGGASAAVVSKIAGAFNQHMMQQMAEADDRHIADVRAETEAWRQERGDLADTDRAHANKAMRAMGIDADFVEAIETGIRSKFPGEGVKKTIEFLAKIGAGMGEDVFGGSTRNAQFTMSPAAAQSELDRYNTDAELRNKIINKDATHMARRNMLIQVVAQAEEAKAKG